MPKATSFCQKEAKTTSFRIRNSLIKIFLQYLESLSLHSNLVKTILTSINFDSFTRKIKNPCLSIKNYLIKGGFVYDKSKKNF